MSNQEDTSRPIRALLTFLAILIVILLIVAYFSAQSLQNPALVNFSQGVIENMIAAILSFLAIYVFLTKKNVSLEVFNPFRQQEIMTKPELESLKTELLSTIREIAPQIGKEIDTQIDLVNYNEFYKFFGLKDKQTAAIFQNFRVSKADPGGNVNPVSFLWADTSSGNTINAQVLAGQAGPGLRVEFESKEGSWGCNIAIRPQSQKAVNLNGQRLHYLHFEASIPEEALIDKDLLHDIGIAVRLVNGKYQHWDYAAQIREYIQFQVVRSKGWQDFYLDLQDKTQWSPFDGDGNTNVNPNELRNADLMIISAVVLKFGKYRAMRGELGPGKGKVDIRDIRFTETQYG